MAVIEGKYLTRLRQAGLFVSSPYSPTHGWPNGVRVGKPKTTAGNSIRNYECSWSGVDMDAPTVVFYSIGDRWIVRAQEGVPLPVPADFENDWETAEDAVNDIIDFFLGDPKRKNAKAALHKEFCDRLARYKETAEERQQ